MTIRIGMGFDAHSFEEGLPLILGGVEIPFHKGLAGHSDGDALVHSVMDALLGAAGLGNKGTYFPSTDEHLRNVSSLNLLANVGTLITSNGWRIVNLDTTILAQQPYLAPYTNQMQEKIGEVLSIRLDTMSVKPTTTDYLGSIGKNEGIAAYAVALIEALQ